MKPILYIIVPCYNEQEVLPVTAPLFLEKLELLRDLGKISELRYDEMGVVSDYTVEGMLIGHLAQGRGVSEGEFLPAGI